WPLPENFGGGDRKNVCNQASLHARNAPPSESILDSAKYETVDDRPLPLPSRANSRARVRRPRLVHAMRPHPKFAMVHRHHARDRSRPVRERAGMIAGTIPFDRATAVHLPNAPPSAAGNAYRWSRTPSFSSRAVAAPNSLSANL